MLLSKQHIKNFHFLSKKVIEKNLFIADLFFFFALENQTNINKYILQSITIRLKTLAQEPKIRKVVTADFP